MKKVLFLMLMFMGLMSSLYALPTVGSGCEVEKSQSLNGADSIATTPADTAIAQVYIWHKDTIHYSLKANGIDIKIPGIGGGYKQNINVNLNSSILAVVCYPRGEGGV